jgi:hypothetical protein
MHDPMTVAFEIKYPWRDKSPGNLKLFPKGYRHTFITIWHVDPEADGTDDSCGWFAPKLSKDQVSRIKSISGDEAREPYFQKFLGKQIESPTEAETLLRQAFVIVGKVLSKEHLCEPPTKRVSFSEAESWACEMLGNPVDNFRTSLSFLPGWSSNRDEDRVEDRQYHAEQFFRAIARYILRERRPWYRHVRWHFWHWKLQCQPVDQFKRWAFSRCADCGGRFTWGYSPWTNSWNGTGPLWFRSEQDVHHSDCKNPKSSGCAQANVGA